MPKIMEENSIVLLEQVKPHLTPWAPNDEAGYMNTRGKCHM